MVGFEAIDQHGRPVNVKGIIKNSSDNLVDSFSTQHEGMGSFRLMPLPGEKYTAYWTDEFGGSHITELPAAKSSGIVIRITPTTDNNIHFQIERTETGSDLLKSLTVISTSQQMVVSKSTLDLQTKSLAEGNINVDQSAAGVMQVTVFDANMNPMAERVVFLYNKYFGVNYLNHPEKVSFGKKGRNEISIEIPAGLTANLSVSVTDGGLSTDSTNNIITDFLLTNDIRGNIANPAYYFNNNNDSCKLYLDLVMLTHGWRRFKWEDMVAGKLPVLNFAPDGEFMVFKGQVKAPNAQLDNSDSIALLMITKDRKKNLLSLPIQSDGNFFQKGMFFYDSVQIVYRLNHASKLGNNTAVNFETSLLKQNTALTAATNPSFQWSKVPDVILEKEIDGLLTELKNYSKQAKGMDYVITPHPKVDSLKTTSETAAHYLEGNFPGMKFPYGVKETGNEDSKFASF